jgi:hypothetical protein
MYMNGITGELQRRMRSAYVNFRAQRLGLSVTGGGRHGGPFRPRDDN